MEETLDIEVRFVAPIRLYEEMELEELDGAQTDEQRALDLIDDLKETYCVDSTSDHQIHLIGFSRGLIVDVD